MDRSLELAKSAAECFRKYFISHLDFRADVKVNRGLSMGPVYSPRLDVAAGPFAIGEKRFQKEYDKIAISCSDFIDNCITKFRENYNRIAKERVRLVENYREFVRPYAFNANSRCSFAIEIEENGSPKHKLGDIVNASCLGRVAILVSGDETTLRSFVRIVEYLSLLKSVQKPTFEPRNVIILD